MMAAEAEGENQTAGARKNQHLRGRKMKKHNSKKTKGVGEMPEDEPAGSCLCRR
jgi:hypothetical protein